MPHLQYLESGWPMSKLECLIYSKPSLLRQVVTKTLRKICRMMTDAVKGIKLKNVNKEKGGNTNFAHIRATKIFFPSTLNVKQDV